MVVEELQILVEAKVNAAVRDLKKLDVQGRATEDTFKKFSAIAKGIIPAVGLASVIGFSKKLVEMTSALDESKNAISVVFGDATDIISDFGAVSAESMGLAESSFNQLATVIGSQLKTAGLPLRDVADETINLTKRAADLASVFNTSVQDATQALGAALRGETEPARRFGINISDAAIQAEALATGLVNSKNEINEQIKVQARLNLIMKQSKDVAGDFESTSDGLANQVRILSANAEDLGASFGEILVPAVTDAVSTLNDMIEPAQAAVEHIKAIIDYVQQARESMTEWEKAIARTTSPLGWAVDATKALYAVVGDLLGKEDEVTQEKKEQLDFTEGISIKEHRRAAIAQATADAEKAIADQMERQQALINDRYLEIRGEVLDVIKSEQGELARLEEAYDRLAAHPWASGKLEDDRQKALAILTEQIKQAKADLWTDSPTDWVAEAMDSITEAEKRAIEAWALQEEALIRQDQLVKNLAASAENALANAWTNSISAMAEALVEGENAFGAFAKTVLLGFADMLQSLSAQLAAYAVVGLFTTGGTLSPAALAGSAAAAAAAGVTRAAANNFKAGGEFTVPEGYENDNYMIGVSSGERVRVDNEDQSNNSSGGGTYHIHVHLGEAEVGSQIFKMSRNGQLMIADRAVVRA